jgi:hypothetical protein
MKIFQLMAISSVIGIVMIFMIVSCNKIEKDEFINQKRLTELNNPQEINRTFNKLSSQEQVKMILDDPDWIVYKSISQDLLKMLLKHKIDLYDTRNFNSAYFYKKLGDDSTYYREKLIKGKSSVTRLYYRYFSDLEVCESCNELTIEKKMAYAELLHQIKTKVIGSSKNKMLAANIGEESLASAPNCWNLNFFACGGICAMTIEAPPVFALCMAYCIAQHCEEQVS